MRISDWSSDVCSSDLGNKSELAVGYCTLYGDMAGGFAVIRDVPKTLVYALARWRNGAGVVIPQSVLDKPPSAELRPGQLRSEERRVGKGCVSTCRSRWSP